MPRDVSILIIYAPINSSYLRAYQFLSCTHHAQARVTSVTAAVHSRLQWISRAPLLTVQIADLDYVGKSQATEGLKT